MANIGARRVGWPPSAFFLADAASFEISFPTALFGRDAAPFAGSDHECA
jgi:hypothetical protein